MSKAYSHDLRIRVLKAVESNYLELGLRKCICKNNSSGFLCICWINFDEQDQTNVQGDARICSNIWKRYNEYFPGFFMSKGFNENIRIFIPKPQSFYEILQILNLNQYIELVEGEKPIGLNRYIKLLGEGKIAIINIVFS